MRLGQLARKYNLKQEQIIAFLDDHNPGMGPYHSNTKLSDQIEDLIARHFNKSFIQESFTTEEEIVMPQEQPVEEPDDNQDELSHNDAVADNEADIQAALDPTLPVIEAAPESTDDSAVVEDPEEPPKVEHNVIETDKLLEMLDSTEEEIDISDITLIKAPKKELDGLKVVGKIDLPEPKPKVKEEVDPEKATAPRKKTDRRGRKALSPEEKEKRRLRAKKKQEAYEARQEKRRLEEESRQQKAKKRAHYEKKVEHLKISKPKVKAKTTKPDVELPVEEVVPSKPKSGIGRYWAWFWRGEKL